MSSILAAVGLGGKSVDIDMTFPRVDLLGVAISAIHIARSRCDRDLD